MKYNKIILAGGNGYLGNVLAKYFKDMAKEVVILSRKPVKFGSEFKNLIWNRKNSDKWAEGLEGADVLVNLCGRNVNCRYTKQNKEAILSSRIRPTRLLGEVILNMNQPPKLWINVSSSTIYRHAEDRPQDEDQGETGRGFSVEICKKWESTFSELNHPKTRKIALRMAIVLGRKGGAFPMLNSIVAAGLGGQQGDGTQYISWIHEHDVARSFEWLIDHSEISGVVNCCSPNAVKNELFMKTLRKAYGIPFGFPTPVWLLNIGARIVGTEPELILKSRWIYPKVLLDAGFQFHYGKIEETIHDIFSLKD